MIRSRIFGSRAAALGLIVLSAAGAGAPAAAAEQVSYRLDVYPILESRCVACHKEGGDGYKQSGLDLSSYAGLLKGTKHGPIVVPGDPVSSNLNVLIEGRADPKLRMPHNQRPLLKEQQQIVHTWVKQGAKDN